MEATFVIIGGGISGISCAESIAFLAPEESVILITASSLIKSVTNAVPFGQTLTQFDVEERVADSFNQAHPTVNIIKDTVVKVDKNNKSVTTEKGKVVVYKKLCICTGAQSKAVYKNSSKVVSIRDVESVDKFLEKLRVAKRIIVIGNGGIATELVHEISGVDVVWVIKDKHIAATFVDPGAAKFFQESLLKTNVDTNKRITKRVKYTALNDASKVGGPALGPDWHNNIELNVNVDRCKSTSVQVEYQCEVLKLIDPSEITDNKVEGWPIYAQLSNGKVIGCDFIVSATGVVPNSLIPGLESVRKGKDGGYVVDSNLETSEKNIYAAGDVCTVGWETALHWFQWRLWTQAYQMGRYAAKAMVATLKGEEFLQDFCFELFTHVTKFFGYKVILLGLFNGQKLDNEYEILLRITKGQEYVKLILKNGKMQGAVLIGETDLEEMCENLILNQLDLSIYGEDLLNPDIDVEDYFD